MRKQIVSIAVICIVLLSACSKMPNHAKYVPKNALLVGTVDMSKLSKKLIWNAITGSELFADMLKDLKNEDSKKAAKDISNIGLDQNSTVYAYYTGSLKADGKMAIVIAMKDASKFEDFIKKTYPSNTIEDNKEYKNCTIEESMLVAWNKEVVMVFPSKKITPTAEIGDSVYNGNAMNVNDMASLKTYLKEMFSLSKENSIVSVSNFAKLQKENHDVSVWMNYEELYKSNKELTSAAAAFMKDEYFKDAALAAGFDFEKGTIDAVMDYHMSKDLATIYGKYADEKVNEDLVKNIPSKDVILLVNYKLNPNMIKDFLEKFKLDGMLNMGLMMAGTSMDKITETFTGDMVFAMTDLKAKQQSDSSSASINLTSDVDMNFVFAMGINDNEHAQKLLGKGIQSGAITKNGNTYTMPSNDKMSLVLDKKYAVVTNNATMTANYIAGKGEIKNAIPSDVYQHVTSNMMGFYVDVNKISKAFPSKFAGKTEDEKQLMLDVQNLLTYAEMYGGNMKNNASHMVGKLNFNNKDENALIQLLNIAVKAKKIKEKKDAATTATAVDSSNVQ